MTPSMASKKAFWLDIDYPVFQKIIKLYTHG